MKKLIVLLVLLMATPANAVVLLIRATVPEAETYLAGKGVCVSNAGDAHYIQYTDDQAGCEGAGHTWLSDIDSSTARRGDIVQIEESGFTGWGVADLRPPAQGGHWVRVDITDKTKAEAVKYIKRRYHGNYDQFHTQWKLLLGSIPAGVLNTLNTTGYYSTTWLVFKEYIYDKVNQVTE